MIKIPYEQLIERIKTEKNIPPQQIEEQIKQKMEQLSGLISKEGAAHILANELGIILTNTDPKLKIRDLYAGLRTGEILGRVMRKFDIRPFQSGERSGKVGSFIIADETGTIRVTCWNDQTKEMEPLAEKDIVVVIDGTVRENRGALEIHLNDRTKLLRNPEGRTVATLQAPPSLRKHIKALEENQTNIEILGTIVQVYDITFFERCPACKKRIKEHGVGFQCPDHGIIKPEYSYVLNLYLDDGSGNIRVVLFGTQIQQLFKKTDDDIQLIRTTPTVFEKIKTNFLGEMIKVSGRVTKNPMFGRLEFIANTVETNVNPEEEISRLQQELEKAQV